MKVTQFFNIASPAATAHLVDEPGAIAPFAPFRMRTIKVKEIAWYLIEDILEPPGVCPILLGQPGKMPAKPRPEPYPQVLDHTPNKPTVKIRTFNFTLNLGASLL
jgi:hypothetical protein